MKKVLAILAISAASLLALGLLGSAPAGAAGSAPVISVSRVVGTQYEYFGFAGYNLTPGNRLHITFVSPEGDEYTWYSDADGLEGERVDRYGTFAITIHPVDDFAGGSFGVWEARFETDYDAVGRVTFSIVRYTTDMPSG